MKLAAKHDKAKELLCLLTPSQERGLLLHELAADLKTTNAGVMTLLKVLDRRGFTTETVTQSGVTRVFAAPAAWKKIKKAAAEYWEETYGW
jgi:DNA-binding IclR family transcriptional regulator